MADETTLVLVVATLSGLAAVIQHFYDRFAPKGLYLRSSRLAADLPARIGLEVENALERVSMRQKALYEADIKAELKQTSLQGVDPSTAMAMVRSVGVDAQTQAKTTRMLAEGMMSSWLPVLRTVLSSVAEQLEENPELIFAIIENPFFKKHVLPRIRGMIPTGEGGVSDVGSGLSV
jgi:hypothetical protein